MKLRSRDAPARARAGPLPAGERGGAGSAAGGRRATPICSVVAGTGEDGTEDSRAATAGLRRRRGSTRRRGRLGGGGSILVADEERRPHPAHHPERQHRARTAPRRIDDPNAVVSNGGYPYVAFQPHAFVVADAIDDDRRGVDGALQPSAAHVGAGRGHTMEDIVASDVEAAGGGGYWVVDGTTVWHLTFVGFPVDRWQARPRLEDLDERDGGRRPAGRRLPRRVEGDCTIVARRAPSWPARRGPAPGASGAATVTEGPPRPRGCASRATSR